MQAATSFLANAPPLARAVTGVLLGCVMDAMVKQLGFTYGVVLIATARYVFGSLFAGAAVLALNARLPDLAGMKRHALRAVVITACSLLFFNCLTILPIAEATVLVFCAPLMISPLARWILGETMRPAATAALVVGFFYGGTLLSGVLPTVGEHVSWDGHLTSAIAGGLLGYFSVAMNRTEQDGSWGQSE